MNAVANADPVPVNLLDLDRAGLLELCQSLGERSFRADQLLKWIHQRGVCDFAQMTDISKSFREYLSRFCVIQPPQMAVEKQSTDGTVKWLMKLEDNNHIETVFIPERRRGTLCISSQVGCVLNCSFCSTGAQGFSRNLKLFEIIGQLWFARQRLKELAAEKGLENPWVISNVVMMGMGEPLLNFDTVVQALSMMRDDKAYALPRRRLTLSTAGVVPQIDRLSEVADVSLAVSLHAPEDSLRNILVPLNKKYPIATLMEACRRYVKGRAGRHITMEYVMLKGVNDSPAYAKNLAKVLQGTASKVNLIPFNPFPGSEYERSTPETIERFKQIVQQAGWITTVRKTRGEDIDGACGQLKGQVIDRTHRQQRFLDKSAQRAFIPLQVHALS